MLYNPSYRGAALKTLTRITCVGLIVSFGWTACTANESLPTVSAAQTASVTSIPTTGATASEPADRITPPPTAPPTGRFSTLPLGAALPSGADCASRVRPAGEIRPQNTTANNNRGSRANANNRTDWPSFDRVDGDFAGTTDELIQWAACKWGIDEDIVRAQMIKESGWIQSANGDNGDSWGIGQVRESAHESAFEYSINARTSTAYNLDYTYASWRACFEGVYTWLNSTNERNGTYAAGDVWGCVGIWFSGRWYYNNDAYLNQTGDSVHWHYDNKTWLTPGFING
jgi:autotransporter family porin